MIVFADKIEMQNRLFAELSRMYALEAPMYDKSLAVNTVCNRVVCDLLAQMHVGLSVSDEQLEKTSGERHGAIRIGRADEYRWIGRFFACFAMEPHNFYDMTSVGSKSQPVIATAFRSVVHPEHRVFSSLLQTSYFDDETRERVETLLAKRTVFSNRAKELIERSELQGGLSTDDADALIGEATGRIFKWTGRARDHALYTDLCEAGFKIAADIACFEAHHLNHLTPNTFCMDLYTAAMKRCLGEIDVAEFRERATRALEAIRIDGGADFVRLSFKHLSQDDIDGFGRGHATDERVSDLVERLVDSLGEERFDLTKLPHSGFKDATEGPASDTPILLRQDAFRALTEAVTFSEEDGTEIEASHTARFGEIEQRFYATTPNGRELYDACLAEAEAARAVEADLASKDHAAYEAACSAHFAAFPKTLRELVDRGLVFARFAATEAGIAARGTLRSTDLPTLLEGGYVRCEGLRYEDFLPISAAGIFASNLNQYGTASTAAAKPVYTQAMLEEILGKPIVDANAVYQGLQSASLLETYAELGLLDRLGVEERLELETAASACPAGSIDRFSERSAAAARV